MGNGALVDEAKSLFFTVGSDDPDMVPENEAITMDEVTLVMDAIAGVLAKTLNTSNQLTITLTRVMPDKKLMYATTVNGVYVTMDDLQNFISAISHLVE